MAKKNNNGFTVAAYPGDGAVLFAFDLEEDKTADLAGFSIHCITPPSSGPYPTNEYFLPNFLNFKNKITSETILDSSHQTGSDKAPFQLFHWVHYPSADPGRYEYTVYASYFGKSDDLKKGPSVKQIVDLSTSQPNSSVELGFTRGYISSQAYADRFHNEPIRPKDKSIEFDTTPYKKKYQWLGAHARKIIFDFLVECQKDPSIYVDVFSYDFDEPDIIQNLCIIGRRVRVFQDDSKLHTGPTALEPQTIKMLRTAGADVKTGHFHRFAHDKVMIQKKKGNAVKVLTGSANFSVRGLYVQANSVIVIDDPAMAKLYEEAFDQAFTNEDKFASSPMAAKWFDVKNSKPTKRSKNNAHRPLAVSFAPHKDASVSLKRVSDAIESANSSVFFAVMSPEGGGEVMSALKKLSNRDKLLSLGTIQMEGQLRLFKRGIDNEVTSFSFLHKNVPNVYYLSFK